MLMPLGLHYYLFNPCETNRQVRLIFLIWGVRPIKKYKKDQLATIRPAVGCWEFELLLVFILYEIVERVAVFYFFHERHRVVATGLRRR
jgi:hypothetical protein